MRQRDLMRLPNSTHRLCLLAGLFFSIPVAADTTEADRLFGEAKQLLAAGQLERACETFARSQSSERALGTLLNLADCHEKIGRTATALREFRESAAWAERTAEHKRFEVAVRRIAALEDRVARIEFVVSRLASTVEILCDGVSVQANEWDGYALDPGPHLVRATAANKRSFSTTISVPQERARLRVEIPFAAEPPVALVSEKGRASATLRQQRSWTLPGLAIASAGVAVAGLLTGSVYSSSAKSSWDSAQPHCQAGLCDEAGVSDGRRAKTQANIATAMISVGAVAAATAIALGIVDTIKRRTHKRSAVSWSPVWTPNAVGLSFGGEL